MDPSVFVKSQNSGRYQAVQVKMIHQSLRPGVEHRDKADPARKTPLPVFGKSGEDLIDRFEQKAQQDLFVADSAGIILYASNWADNTV